MKKSLSFTVIFLGVYTAFILNFFLFHSQVFAQTASSNCVITNIGNPGNTILPPQCASGGSTALSKTALALVAAAKPCGNISQSNYQCMSNNIQAGSMPFPEAAKVNIYNGLFIHANPFQCINFVEVAVAGTYGNRWNYWPD